MTTVADSERSWSVSTPARPSSRPWCSTRRVASSRSPAATPRCSHPSRAHCEQDMARGVGRRSSRPSARRSSGSRGRCGCSRSPRRATARGSSAATHQPVRPAVLWNDGRAADIVRGWRADGVLERAYRINGSLTNAGLPNAILRVPRRDRARHTRSDLRRLAVPPAHRRARHREVRGVRALARHPHRRVLDRADRPLRHRPGRPAAAAHRRRSSRSTAHRRWACRPARRWCSRRTTS